MLASLVRERVSWGWSWQPEPTAKGGGHGVSMSRMLRAGVDVYVSQL